MAANGIKIIIRADVREAEKALRAIEQQAAKVRGLEAEYAKLKKEYAASGKAAEKAAKDVDASFAKLKAAKEKQTSLAAGIKGQFDLGGGIDTSAAYQAQLKKNKEYQKASAEVNQLKESLGHLQEAMSAAEVKQGDLGDRVSGVGGDLAREREELGRLSEKANEASGRSDRVGKAFSAIKKFAATAAGGVARLGKAFAGVCGKIKSTVSRLGAFRLEGGKVQGAVQGFSKAVIKLGTLLKMAVLRKAIQGIVRAAREGFENLAQYSAGCNDDLSALQSSLTQLKNSFATAFAPILSVVTPALTSLIDQLSKAITYVGMLFAALSGAKTFTKAIAVNEDYAKSLKATGKATKDAQATVAGFDLLNILNDNNSSGGGGVSPSEMFEEVKIPPFVEELTDLIEGKDWEELGAYIADGINKGLSGLETFISWDNLGAGITEAISGITGSINSVVSHIDWELIGQALGTGVNTLVNTLFLLFTGIDWYSLGSSLAIGLNAMIASIDWYHMGEAIGAWFDMSINTALGFVQTFDWGAAGLALGSALQGMVNSIDWANLGTLIGDALKGAFTFLYTAIENFDWVQLGEDVKTMLVNIDWGGVFTAMCRTMGAAFGGLVGFLWGLLKDAWQSVVDWWHDKAFEDGKFTIEGLLKGIVDAVASIGTWIYEHIFQPFINGFKNAFGIHSPSTVMAEMGRYMIDGIKSTFSVDALKSIGANAVTGLMNGLRAVGSKVTAWGAGILGNIKDALGVHSPSTETKDVGEYTVEGLINGLDSYSGRLKATITTIMDAVIDLFKKAFEIILESQGVDQETALSSLNAWMTSVEGLFQAFYGNLTAQTTSWASTLQGTLDGMVKAAKTAASSISSSLSSARSSSASIGSLQNSKARETAARVNTTQGVAFRVPAYATGAVLPANQPHLAILGDQKHGTNIETPESLLRKVFREESNNEPVIAELREILGAIREGKVIVVEKRALGKVVNEAMALSARTSGASIIRTR